MHSLQKILFSLPMWFGNVLCSCNFSSSLRLLQPCSQFLHQPCSLFFLKYAELLVHCYCPSWDYRWETRDTSDRIICGRCARWKHQGWNMLLCRSLDQVQPEVIVWCVRAIGNTGPDRTHWQNVSAFTQKGPSINDLIAVSCCGQSIWGTFEAYWTPESNYDWCWVQRLVLWRFSFVVCLCLFSCSLPFNATRTSVSIVAHDQSLFTSYRFLKWKKEKKKTQTRLIFPYGFFGF